MLTIEQKKALWHYFGRGAKNALGQQNLRQILDDAGILGFDETLLIKEIFKLVPNGKYGYSLRITFVDTWKAEIVNDIPVFVGSGKTLKIALIMLVLCIKSHTSDAPGLDYDDAPRHFEWNVFSEFLA